MKFFTGWLAAAGLVLVATAAQAQVPASDGAGRPSPHTPASDVGGPPPGGPLAAMPPEAPRPGYGPGYGSGPMLLPSMEVYTVVRENGFSPLGIPHLRGSVYTIAVIDHRGDDGRLVIDARDGRILRFLPAADAYGMAPAGIAPVYDERAVAPYGPHSALPQPTQVRGGPPRPPAPIPHVASRAVPLPKAAPPRAPVVAKPAESVTPQAQPAQQTAAVQAKPADAVPQAAAPTVGQAKPAATILPTQNMPAAQGLD
jgi:hypothetical protein